MSAITGPVNTAATNVAAPATATANANSSLPPSAPDLGASPSGQAADGVANGGGVSTATGASQAAAGVITQGGGGDQQQMLINALTQLIDVLNKLVAALQAQVSGGGGMPDSSKGGGPDSKGGGKPDPGQKPGQFPGQFPGQVPGKVVQQNGITQGGGGNSTVAEAAPSQPAAPAADAHAGHH